MNTNRPAWPASRVTRLEELLEKGYSLTQCAEALGTTYGSVTRAMATNHLRAQELRRVLTVKDVAHAMGVGHETVEGWCKDGLLKHTSRLRRGVNHTLRFIKPEDLAKLIEDRSSWADWDHERIRDPELREHATTQRLARPTITAAEAAAHHHVEPQTVRRWALEGRLTPVSKRGKLLFDRAEILAFTPPCDSPRRHPPKPPSLSELAVWVALRLAGHTPTEISQARGHPKSTIYRVLSEIPQDLLPQKGHTPRPRVRNTFTHRLPPIIRRQLYDDWKAKRFPTQAALARHYQVHPYTVQYHVRRFSALEQAQP